MRSLLVLLVCLFGLLPPASAHAEEARSAGPSSAGSALPADSVTSHRIRVGDQDLAYTATAGSLPTLDARGERKADLFYVAYTLDGADVGRRPVTFAFNGGPGAASAYLHLGLMGPRVLDVGDDPAALASARTLIDNPDSWLAVTDLVFVDPVGTGYSRATGSDDEVARQFWGVRQDVEVMAGFVRLWLARNRRIGSPKVLAGESYGGFRAVKLAEQLQSEEGFAPSALVLISPVLEFETLGSNPYLPMSWALRLPSYAATALERQGRLTPDALVPVERYALGDYLAGLAAGPRDGPRAERLYDEVARLTGLPRDVVARQGGRIPAGLFVKEIGRAEGRLASRYDGTVSTVDPFPGSLTARGDDPVLDGTRAPFTTGFVGYVRETLGYRTDRRYRLLSGEIAARWDWRSGGGGHGFGSQGFAGALDDLRALMALNPRLRVMVAHGMTDLVTPYFASRVLLDQLPPRRDGGDPVLQLYPGGHMMYLRPANRAALRRDVAPLYAAPD